MASRNLTSETMSKELLDHDLAKQLASLVETLTTSGSPTLNPEQMKDFKKICKKSDLYIEHAFRLLMSQLSMKHAEIRLSTFQVISEIFSRSHCFRELLLSDFKNYLALTVETELHHQPLPPPKEAAKKLKEAALKAVQQWQDKYGSGYPKLALGYRYLEKCKHVNFGDIRARTLAEQRHREEQEQKKQRALRNKLEKARKEFSELQKEITDTAMAAENCIELLLPKPDLLFTESDFGAVDVLASSSFNTGRSESTSKPSYCVSSSQNVTCTVSSSTCNSGDSEKCTSSKSSSVDSGNRSNKSTSQKNTHEPPEYGGGQSANSDSEAPSTRSSDGVNGAAQDCDTSGKTQNTSPGALPHKNSDSKSNDSNDNTNDDDDDDDDDDVDFEAVDGEEAEELGLVQLHGLGSRKYNLQIEIDADAVCMTETEDNKDIVHSLKDASCLVTLRFLPQVVRWLEVLSKTGGSGAEIKAMIDLKLRLENIKAKSADLHIVPDSSAKEQLSDSDEDMEEVPEIREKEGYEPVIPDHLRAEYGLHPKPTSSKQSASAGKSSSSKMKASSTSGKSDKGKEKVTAASSTSGKSDKGKEKVTAAATAGPSGSLKKSTSASWNLNERNKSTSVQDPASRAANLVRLGLKDEARPSTSKGKPATMTSSSSAGSSDIPTLPYGLDLAYWGTPEKIEAPSVLKNDSLHRFWKPAEVEHEKPSQNDIAAVMNRTFYYTGQFTPVKWKCRAKLPNGKLCERMDRVKCPFHGKIIPRDEDGCPANPEDAIKETEKIVPTVKSEPADEEKHEVPPWLDADLQAEIEAATGHDLGSKRSKAIADKAKGVTGKGKGKGKKRKYEGLTDIKESKNTSRARLEKKIFNKKSMKRVAGALDAADYKRVRDMFASQFNYAIKK